MEKITRLKALELLTAREQDYELMPVTSFGREGRGFVNGPQTLRDLYRQNQSDETFLVFGEERYSFRESYQKSVRIASILSTQYGVKKGDRVAISMRNYPEWVMSFAAITSMGAIAVAMNALWTSEEMQYGLADSGAKVLIADQERVDRVVSILSTLDIAVIAVRPRNPLLKEISDLSDLLDLSEEPQSGNIEGSIEDQEADLFQVDLDAFDKATILYTSGSTGHPKGAVSTHKNILTALMSWELDARASVMVAGGEPILPISETSSQLGALLAVPLFHATGLHAVLLASYRHQRKVVLMYKWDSELATSIIEHEQITNFVAPAAMTGDLIETAKRESKTLSSLVTVGGGGAPRAPAQVRNIAASFDKALPGTGWGMTETNAIGTSIGGQDYLDHAGSSGRCSAVLDIKIVDDEGTTMPAGERGELLITGTSVIEGYWNRPEANLETFVDGWLKTGDVAYLDEEGYLYIVDRIKDLVIRGGENIGCAEVEAGLLVHPAIIEASVYAVPDDRLGEEVGATIYVREELAEGELRFFLEQHLAKFKIPKYIQFSHKPLPRIASGKIDKRRIREKAVA